MGRRRPCAESGVGILTDRPQNQVGVDSQQRLRRQYPRVNWKAGRLLNRSGAAAWARQMIDG